MIHREYALHYKGKKESTQKYVRFVLTCRLFHGRFSLRPLIGVWFFSRYQTTFLWKLFVKEN